MPAPKSNPGEFSFGMPSPELLADLRALANDTDRLARWPGEQLRRCADAGLLRWFAPPELGGVTIGPVELLRHMTRLASACLTTTFCLTQPAGVIGRIAACDNEELKRTLLPQLLDGRCFASVGIAHLTTSRRHTQPVMTAREEGDDLILDGIIPWSTGAKQSTWIVTGAVLEDGRQLLAALPTNLPGVTVEPPAEMVGLSATHTGAVRCDGVRLERKWLMAPVMRDVLKFGKGAGTGGLQTSALALGTALAAIEFLADEALRRPDLARIVAGLREQWEAADADLATLAEVTAALSGAKSAGAISSGATDGSSAGASSCDFKADTGRQAAGGNQNSNLTSDAVRRGANELALRSAQAALAAAKGSGYVVGHPAGRWCREALFFLVWSCPEPVTTATLCDLAKI